MHLDHLQPQPAPDYLDALTIAWSEHLKRNGVPWQEVPGLYDNAVSRKARGEKRGFMPTVEDLLFEWSELVEAGYWEKENEVEELPALPPGEMPLAGLNTDRAPQFVRAFAGIPNGVLCNCPGDKWGGRAASLFEGVEGWTWVCAKAKCDFRILASEVEKLAEKVTPTETIRASPILFGAAFYETAARMAGYDLEMMQNDHKTYESFKMFVDWCRERRASLSKESAPQLLAEWKQAVEESREVAATG